MILTETYFLALGYLIQISKKISMDNNNQIGNQQEIYDLFKDLNDLSI